MAFDWLQEQPEPVKATVHTPERLVSLFRKSQRLNDVDAPVSSKKFITDLKNLATSLDQFDGSTPQVIETKPKPSEKKSEPLESVIRYQTAPQAEKKATEKPKIEAPQKTASIDASDFLDPQSREKIQRVMTRFNLSSEKEALRLIISLGYEKFTDFK